MVLICLYGIYQVRKNFTKNFLAQVGLWSYLCPPIMKKITVKVPTSLEKPFIAMVKAEFAGNYNKAVNSLIAERLGLGNGLEDEIDEIKAVLAKVVKVLRDKELDV